MLRKQAAAQLIQKKWRDILTNENKLVSVILGKTHSARPDLMYFLNNQKIKKSLNLDKRKILLQALAKGDWKHSIFNDSNLAYYAMTLYMRADITTGQLSSMLDLIAIKENFTIIQFYPVLDNNKITVAARNLLLPLLNNSIHFAKLENKTLALFCDYVKKLPISEQFFYRTDLGRYSQHKIHRLGEILAIQDVLHFERHVDKRSILHLTTGVRDALSKARFCEVTHISSLSALGIFSREHIESGVRQGFRPRATPHPQVKAFSQIHGHHDVISLEASGHDDYHAYVLAAIPRPIRAALLRFVDVTRKAFDVKWSKEIWDWIDCDFKFAFMKGCHFNVSSESDIEKMTNLLIKILNFGNSTTPGNFSKGGFIVQRHDTFLNPVGAAIFLDMIKNQKEWIAIGIHPNYFNGIFKEWFDEISKNYFQIKNDNALQEILNCQVFLSLKLSEEESWHATYHAYLKKSSYQLQFKKVAKKEIVHLCPNMIYTILNGSIISTQKQLAHFAKSDIGLSKTKGFETLFRFQTEKESYYSIKNREIDEIIKKNLENKC